MIALIQENISRQHKGLTLLLVLLEEEFACLMRHDAQGITSFELSIQELMRQLANERTSLKRMVKKIEPVAERVRDIFSAVPDEQRAILEELLEQMSRQEQTCAVQAAKNQELVLALYDQSSKLLDYMHKQISPPENKDGYSAKGQYAKARTGQATFMRGRF